MHCRICKEPLRVSELKRRTCDDCENEVTVATLEQKKRPHQSGQRKFPKKNITQIRM